MQVSMPRAVAPILLLQIFLAASYAPLVGGESVSGDTSVMNRDLVEAITGESNELIEVIYQLQSPVLANDIEFMNELGLEILGSAPLINGGLVSGSRLEVLAFSEWIRIEHLELNKELEFFYLPPQWGGQSDAGVMMHETTHIVNATTSWSRAIVDVYGNVQFDSDGAFTQWDGDGTAIVDLDTGVDAGHPDYDYADPWGGEKTLYSAKFNGVTWQETRNSDSSSGHGTHVGGTIAGNGDASAGRRAGVSKGGQLIALGTGDGASIFAAEQGLEWTYEHSRRGHNDYDIRVVSNSWGTDGDYNPNGAIAKLTDRLTFENGVAVIFAASNSAGTGDECSGGLKTNVYANTPSAISVAALTHDGSEVTSFSSRGCKMQQHTWPDVGAPGRNIWATAPRATAIDMATKAQGQSDLYYMAISGTSMATPHVGGMAGLLIDAAPSLGVADYHRDDHDEIDSQVGGAGTAAYGQYENWTHADFSRVHEVELILELTADYEKVKNSCEAGNDADPCNDIPDECYISNTGRCHDWRVGHGLTNTDAAVALARTLQLMRDPDDNGVVDNPEATVWDAYEHYKKIMTEEQFSVDTDRVRHAWKGDWNHFNNGQNGAVFSTDDTHYMYIPNGTTRLEAVFAATEWKSDTMQVGTLQLSIDLGEDGDNDAQGLGSRNQDTWYYDIDVSESHWGKWCEFDILGNAVTLIGFIEDQEFFEASIAYTVDVVLTIDLSQPQVIDFEQRPDFYSELDPTTPSDDWDDSMAGRLTFIKDAYNQSRVVSLYQPKVAEPVESEGFITSLGDVFEKYPAQLAFFSFFIIMAAISIGWWIRATRTDEPLELVSVLEAEIID